MKVGEATPSARSTWMLSYSASANSGPFSAANSPPMVLALWAGIVPVSMNWVPSTRSSGVSFRRTPKPVSGIRPLVGRARGVAGPIDVAAVDAEVDAPVRAVERREHRAADQADLIAEGLGRADVAGGGGGDEGAGVDHADGAAGHVGGDEPVVVVAERAGADPGVAGGQVARHVRDARPLQEHLRVGRHLVFQADRRAARRRRGSGTASGPNTAPSPRRAGRRPRRPSRRSRTAGGSPSRRRRCRRCRSGRGGKRCRP